MKLFRALIFCAFIYILKASNMSSSECLNLYMDRLVDLGKRTTKKSADCNNTKIVRNSSSLEQVEYVNQMASENISNIIDNLESCLYIRRPLPKLECYADLVSF